MTWHFAEAPLGALPKHDSESSRVLSANPAFRRRRSANTYAPNVVGIDFDEERLHWVARWSRAGR